MAAQARASFMACKGVHGEQDEHLECGIDTIDVCEHVNMLCAVQNLYLWGVCRGEDCGNKEMHMSRAEESTHLLGCVAGLSRPSAAAVLRTLWPPRLLSGAP